MSSNFPAAIDTESELPDAETMHAQTLGSFPHSELHGNANEALIALQTKVGVTGSTDPASHTYLLALLAAAVDALEVVTASPAISIGMILMYGGGTAPTGYLMCDGSPVARSTYDDLFDTIGILYGAGNGTSTFNVPNLTNRMPVGAGGTYTRGNSGGSATHALTLAEIPSHDHDSDASFAFASGIIDYEMSPTTNGPPWAGMQLSTNTTIPKGGGGAHNNMPPYQAVNYIIKALA